MKKSYLIAAALTLAIVSWMLAGHFMTPKSQQTASDTSATVKDSGPMTVEISSQNATATAQHIVAQGQVEPNRAVTVRAETSGRIAEVVAEEGQPVKTGDVLVRLEMNDRQARLAKAKALLQERQSAYQRIQQLGEKGYQTQRQIDEAFSALRTAQADLAAIELEIKNTTVRAPFDGILEKRHVTVGDYVAVNGEIATVVDNNPLVVTVQIPQQDIGKLTLESVADISFATGQYSEGVVQFIAPRADQATRTFRVEVEADNPDGKIPSGISAEAKIPTGMVSAHFVSPALLTLDDAGQVGVKTVNEANIVEFHPVTIVQAEAKGVWVSGLPETARIITLGQGFVRDGELVQVAAAQGSNARPSITPDATALSQSQQDNPERLP